MQKGPLPSITVERIGEGPIIHAEMTGLEGSLGENINGPSLLRVPDWIEDPLGRYYLYFAITRGSSSASRTPTT